MPWTPASSGLRRLARAATLCGGLAACAPWLGRPGLEAERAFYTAPAGQIPGPPGSILRREPAEGAPEGTDAWRLLYRSTGLRGEPILVSGLAVVPRGAPPPGGRPVVAWTHPTSGVVPRCAPSLAFFRFQQIQGLREMAERGWIVVATDYPGLGTAGPHPYLVGTSEARAVLDSVRAVRALPGSGAGGRFAVWGHSQGGQAALFTGLQARDHAPELHLVGVAAAAPATELGVLLNRELGTVAGNNLTAMTLWSWARVFGAPVDRVVTPAAIPVVDRLAEECIESLYDLWARARTEQPLAHSFLTERGFAAAEPWRSLLAENTPGPLPAGIPLFLAQGTADTIVLPPVTRDYRARSCSAGLRVRMVEMAGVGHGFIAHDAAPAAIDWMAGRFAGAPPPSDC